MSIVLQNFVQITQGARVKPLPPIITGRHPTHRGLDRARHFVVQLSNMQIIIIVTTVPADGGLLAASSPNRRSAAPSAPASRTTKMAALLGVDVDRTISLTFVMGAALAAVAGLMFLLYYGVIDFYIGFLAGIKAFTAAVLGGIGSLPGAMLGGLLIGLIEVVLVGLFLGRVQGRRRLLDPRHRADLPALRPARPAGSREGLSVARPTQLANAAERAAQASSAARGMAERRGAAQPPDALDRSDQPPRSWRWSLARSGAAVAGADQRRRSDCSSSA